MSSTPESSGGAAATDNDEGTSYIAKNLESVRSLVTKTLAESDRPSTPVRLVAVSKTKPSSALMEAYEAGQRHFGENYAQELMGKYDELPKDIRWHFIGPLQSNKAAPLVKKLGETLFCVETVSTIKLASKLSNARLDSWSGPEGKKLGVYLQVNTSGEESKSGLEPKDLRDFTSQVLEKCEGLNVRGLMTIGAVGDISCFDTLVKCREDVKDLFDYELELSMGMSGDYEEAIKRGSTNVRVGSTIFGARDYGKK